MKSLRYLLISLLAMLTTGEAFACWYDWYDVSGYYMYRVYEEPSKVASKTESEDLAPEVAANCAAWQQLTSEAISVQEIYEVVYKMPLADFKKMCDNREANYENKFAEWITKRDRAILDFLLLAKTNEYIRVKRNSRWFYPTMDIGVDVTIEQVAEQALAAKDKRLRDRYLLQAVRALFSMARYTECVALWESEASKLPADNIMRKHIQPYIAGAEFRLKNRVKAIEYFAQVGDIESVLFCANCEGEKLSTYEALVLVSKRAPNSPSIAKTLQMLIRSIEPDGSMCGRYGGGYVEQLEAERKSMIARLRPHCLEMARDNRCDSRAMWYYTAAFLSEVNGETSRASQLLSLAEKTKATDYIRESIKVFRIYLDAKLSKYDAAYDARLFEQIKWLDDKIVNNIDSGVAVATARGYHLNNGTSYYYWNDMLRRILLAEVCPRMLKAGRATRALQLANMADNRLLNLVNRKDFYQMFDIEKSNSRYAYDYKNIQGATLSEFRYAAHKFNLHDYSNHFFELADSLGVNSVKRYAQNLSNPTSEFDRYLNARGYTGEEYINDIVGTHCIREMRYGEAVKCLENVSEAYNKNHLNIIMQYDPFSVARESVGANFDTRYEFAKEMHALEQAIKSEKDPNIKAQKMLRFSIGLRNSFDRCWPLTQYYRGECYWGCVMNEKRNWEVDAYTTAAIKKAQYYAELACKTATNEEVAANIQYELCNFKTVAESYPNTTKGKLVRGKCDKLIDYHAEKHNTRPANYYSDQTL